MPGHELIGEGLAALQARCVLGRPHDGQPGRGEAVHDAVDERLLGPDERKVDGFCLCKCNEALNVRRAKVNVGGRLSGARIAWGGKQGRDGVALGKRLGEGVLAPAASYHENSHTVFAESVR